MIHATMSSTVHISLFYLFLFFVLFAQQFHQRVFRIKIIYVICRFMNINFICKNEHTQKNIQKNIYYYDLFVNGLCGFMFNASWINPVGMMDYKE